MPVTELAAQKKYLAVRYLLAPNLQRKKALMVCKPMKNRSGNAASPACVHRRKERIYEKAIVWVTQARPAADRVAAVYSHVTRRESSAGRLDIDHRRRPAGS